MMRIGELTDDERFALIALAKLVVRADHDLSHEEADELRKIAAEMGAELFLQTTREAQQRFKSVTDVKLQAERVLRPDARRLIFDYLYELASPGNVVEEERKVLRWLAGLWQLGDDRLNGSERP
jgi:uncharacterized tellurite resistance protein B-like protein